MRQYTVSENEEGRRTVQFLRKLMPEAPSGFIYRALREKNVKVNHKKTTPEAVLAAGDVVELYFSDDRLRSLGFIGSMGGPEEPAQAPRGTGRPSDFPDIPVLFEDDNLTVWNKPAGVLSQKDAKTSYSLSEYAADHLRARGIQGTYAAGVSQRLDRNTTGIVLSANNLRSSRSLSEAIRNRTCRKEYLALGAGECHWKGKMLLVHRFAKDAAANVVRVERVTVQPVSNAANGGEEAWKKFLSGKEREAKEESWIACCASVLEAKNGYTLFLLELLTGKSHQLRAQLAEEGYPLAGDVKYGPQNTPHGALHASRPLLHAFRFTLTEAAEPLSSYVGMVFEAPLPEDMKKALERAFSGEKTEVIMKGINLPETV